MTQAEQSVMDEQNQIGYNVLATQKILHRSKGFLKDPKQIPMTRTNDRPCDPMSDRLNVKSTGYREIPHRV
jgi:hypothetical protein